MSGLDVFVLIVVPGAIVLMCAAGLWLQARANRAVQVHVKRLDELNAAAAARHDAPEEPTAQSVPIPQTPVRAAGQFSLPLSFITGTLWAEIFGWRGTTINGQSHIVS
jgi:hypothetical protein